MTKGFRVGGREEITDVSGVHIELVVKWDDTLAGDICQTMKADPTEVIEMAIQRLLVQSVAMAFKELEERL